MDIRDGFSDAVGNTPLIRLKEASELTGCEILGKAEFLNPGGSVKDRAALYMILDAERKGTLQPGGVIVEGTAGNTGIGLTLVANARGYRTVIVIPETQSREKMDMLRLCGAELIPVPAKPYKDPDNYVRQSERVAAGYAEKEPNGALWGKPVGQPGQLAGTLPIDRPGNLGADRRQGGRIYLRYGDRRHAGRDFNLSEGTERGRKNGSG